MRVSMSCSVASAEPVRMAWLRWGLQSTAWMSSGCRFGTCVCELVVVRQLHQRRAMLLEQHVGVTTCTARFPAGLRVSHNTRRLSSPTLTNSQAVALWGLNDTSSTCKAWVPPSVCVLALCAALGNRTAGLLRTAALCPPSSTNAGATVATELEAVWLAGGEAGGDAADVDESRWRLFGRPEARRNSSGEWVCVYVCVWQARSSGDTWAAYQI